MFQLSLSFHNTCYFYQMSKSWNGLHDVFLSLQLYVLYFKNVLINNMICFCLLVFQNKCYLSIATEISSSCHVFIRGLVSVKQLLLRKCFLYFDDKKILKAMGDNKSCFWKQEKVVLKCLRQFQCQDRTFVSVNNRKLHIFMFFEFFLHHLYQYFSFRSSWRAL